jgi:serine/threonine protein kinase/tetratricopeptide (TPR) repeat protein
MDQDRWRTVNEIFHAALAVSSSERGEFVARAANGDEELQAEVTLLLKADEDAGSYIESPLVSFSLFSSSLPQIGPGDLLGGRFRLLREVGSGGMGQVFEAVDTELSVPVALKVIRPEIATNAEALARFRQEVRLARRITHPNVCRTYDIERATVASGAEGSAGREIVFLTMEFLPGETLAARIQQQGALPLDEAHKLAQQIGSALEAAHALGVVHRDIKPGNIMLVPDGDAGQRAVVTDFGLARSDRPDALQSWSGTSHKGNPIGTLAYMAPEQLEGAPVSAATDIYAFGLTLFEMVTGKRAFPSDNLLSGITQRLTGAPPNPKAVVPELPEAWQRAIAGCLCARPEERFASASDVVAVLDGRKRRGSVALAWRRTRAWFTRGRAIAAALILLVAVSLFWAGLRYAGMRRDAKVAPGALVYLPPVRNDAGEKAFDNITELIRAGLSQSAQINLLDQGRVRDTLQHMTKAPDTIIDEPIAREIAMRTGAARVVFATVSGSGGKYSLNVDVQQPDNTPARYRAHWTKSFPWQNPEAGNSGGAIPQELLSAVRDASDWIRHEAGESANDITRLDAAPEDVTTDSWEALAEYGKAENLYGQGKTEEAVVALSNAVKIDPQFALAFARQGDLYVALGRTRDGYGAYAHALATDFERRLSRRELDRIRGIYASDSWDYQTADAAFHDYTVYYDGDYTGWFFRALPLIRLGRLEEAIASLRHAYVINPTRASAPYDIAACYIELGDLSSARNWIETLRRIPHPDAVAQLEGIIAVLEGRHEEAQSKFELLRASTSPIFRLRAYSFLARLAAERGEYKDALQWINTGIDEAASDGNDAQRAAFLMDRAYLRMLTKNYDESLGDANQSLALEDAPEIWIGASELYGKAIEVAPQNIRSSAQQSLNALAQRIPMNQQNIAYAVASMRVRTEWLLARGQWEEALAEARRAATADMQFRRRNYLARALVEAALHAPDPARRSSLWAEAREAYSRTALHPAAIWIQPSLYLPGALAADASAYLMFSGPDLSPDADSEKVKALIARMQLHPPPAPDSGLKNNSRNLHNR